MNPEPRVPHGARALHASSESRTRTPPAAAQRRDTHLRHKPSLPDPQLLEGFIDSFPAARQVIEVYVSPQFSASRHGDATIAAVRMIASFIFRKANGAPRALRSEDVQYDTTGSLSQRCATIHTESAVPPDRASCPHARETCGPPHARMVGVFRGEGQGGVTSAHIPNGYDGPARRSELELPQSESTLE